MQKGYHYEITQPMGRNFHPDFKPELTPKQMLKLGVFGGRYLRDCRNEFPADWFAKAELLPNGFAGHDKRLNYFEVDASQSLLEWRKKGGFTKMIREGGFNGIVVILWAGGMKMICAKLSAGNRLEGIIRR